MRSILKSIFKYVVFFIFTIFMCFVIYKKTPIKKTDVNNLDLSNIHNLMIVAHPDDETIWGGAHLLEDNYLVVCITCGTDRTRVEEFKKALSISSDSYVMLGYPDKTNNKRDDWSKVYDNIVKDIERIIALKKWDTIVTHNEDGEYGHIHHKMTNNIVKSVYENNKITSHLYFFGKYYNKNDIDLYKERLIPIDNNSKDIKINKMLSVYKSQSFITDYFGHMFNYENWQEYSI